MPNSITYLNWTPIIEWYVVWCGSKNKYQKAIFNKRWDYVLKMVTILGSITNIIGGDLYIIQ